MSVECLGNDPIGHFVRWRSSFGTFALIKEIPKLYCDRCGTISERLYEMGQEDDGEIIMKKLCWDCDHDVSNGGDLFEGAGDVLMDRAENDYAYDPIYYPKPSWMP